MKIQPYSYLTVDPTKMDEEECKKLKNQWDQWDQWINRRIENEGFQLRKEEYQKIKEQIKKCFESHEPQTLIINPSGNLFLTAMPPLPANVKSLTIINSFIDRLDLSHCKNLKELKIINCSGLYGRGVFPNSLESLVLEQGNFKVVDLQDTYDLKELKISKFDDLVILNLSNCKVLTELSITECCSLRKLDLSHCELLNPQKKNINKAFKAAFKGIKIIWGAVKFAEKVECRKEKEEVTPKKIIPHLSEDERIPYNNSYAKYCKKRKPSFFSQNYVNYYTVFDKIDDRIKQRKINAKKFNDTEDSDEILEINQAFIEEITAIKEDVKYEIRDLSGNKLITEAEIEKNIKCEIRNRVSFEFLNKHKELARFRVAKILAKLNELTEDSKIAAFLTCLYYLLNKNPRDRTQNILDTTKEELRSMMADSEKIIYGTSELTIFDKIHKEIEGKDLKEVDIQNIFQQKIPTLEKTQISAAIVSEILKRNREKNPDVFAIQKFAEDVANESELNIAQCLTKIYLKEHPLAEISDVVPDNGDVGSNNDNVVSNKDNVDSNKDNVDSNKDDCKAIDCTELYIIDDD